MLNLGAPSVEKLKTCCQNIIQPTDDSLRINARKVLDVMEKLSAIAIGIFAAISGPVYFAGSFALGVALGLLSQRSTVCACGPAGAASSCSIGFLERNTGVKLPALVSLVAGFAVMAEHIRHHSHVFVPITGVTLGYWVGTVAQPTVNQFVKKAVNMADRCFA